ncbi:MAG: fasciclin domain-containing protein [Flavisolibacter sp.]
MQNITQLVSEELDMTTLSMVLQASGLNQLLENAGPYTVFAPSEMAFSNLEAGTIQNLLKPENKAELTNLLSNHIVSGRLKFEELKNGDKIKTLSGKEIKVAKNWGKTSVEGAIIQNRDVETSNGTIHSLDKVIQN